jgi:hypothetical protein
MAAWARTGESTLPDRSRSHANPAPAPAVDSVVHREGNPGTEANEAIVFRVGEGEVLVNVDRPRSSSS